MDNDVVIRADGLGKRYVIGHQAERESYVALRDVIARNLRNFGRTAMDVLRGRPNVAGDELEEFWALKDVNFEIRRGEVVGVIGRNGAGKSTLLKVLSRITEPTVGRIEIRGRVASLLEVGTGFHPELTGRENIYLNGAILGMTHGEIRRKFDEIVDFAEVERFLDTPVKRYSSGMYVRLAFAVAAHLEPEILIVDEVLAVGDAEFQKKCLGKMGEVAGQGRTVLFVSHNMAAVATLCEKAILLRQGQVEHQGDVASGLKAYAEMRANSSALRPNVSTKSRIHFSDLNISNSASPDSSALEISAVVEASQATAASVEVIIKNNLGFPVLFYNSGTTSRERYSFIDSNTNIRISIPIDILAQGEYTADIQIVDPGNNIYDRLEDAYRFTHIRFDDGLKFDQNWGNGSVMAANGLMSFGQHE